MKYESHDFYCINCGEKNFPIQRGINHLRKGGHKKKLYCWHCQKEVNMVECITPKDVEKFKRKFKAGEFLEEAKESILHSSR